MTCGSFRTGAGLLTYLMLAWTVMADAQLSGSNLLVGQAGNYPRRAPTDRQDLYDQANVAYVFAAGNVGLRWETNRNSEEQFAYEGITQRWADWSDGRYRVRVGSFYTLLGRGLTHRSFELPGVVLDQQGIRSRYAFSREMDGALAELTHGPIHAILFSGTPNGGESSLAADKLGLPRFAGQSSGGEIAATLYRNARIGATFSRSNAGGSPQQDLGSGFVELDPLLMLGHAELSLPLYFEYAQANGDLADWTQLRRGAERPHALYSSAGLLWGRLGVSAEWKDYAQFRFGTNDPPSLVREHVYALLNRGTHVLDAGRETGYQFETTYGLTDAATLTGNVSRGDGLGKNRFDEAYAELRVAPRGAHGWEAAAFYARSKDLLSSLDRSRTLGGLASTGFGHGYYGHIDVQRQTAERTGSANPVPFENVYVAMSATRSNLGSLAMVWERTSDPADKARFGSGRAFVHLIHWVLNARLSAQHEATLTVGKLRGGRACTAGTCYVVPSFEGAELRLVSRF